MLEQVDCHYCGSKNHKILHGETELIRAEAPCKVVKCTQCGLTYLNPRPGDDENQTKYNEEYYRAYLEESHMAGGNDEISPFLVKRLEKLEILKPSRGVLLEIGSGLGHFLYHARARGWKTKGIEISNWAAEISGKRYGLDIHHGTLQKAKLPSSSCDVIHLNHVLEHLPYPVETLKEAARVLKPDGLLVIEVPNEFGDLYCRVLRLMAFTIEPYVVPSSHLFFFTVKTLTRVIEKAGLGVAVLRTYRNDKEFGTHNVLAVAIKRMIFKMEEVLDRGPLIEVFAAKR